MGHLAAVCFRSFKRIYGLANSQQAARSSEQDTIKETFESIVIAFILAFVFRAYVVEAFVIPTGSMAPTLLGRHVRVACSQCGYRYAADAPIRHDTSSALHHESEATCPMCHYDNVLPIGTRISAGDRILVHKYIYSMSQPRRWDVAVFKAPYAPDVNFIKRVVGLPNERLWLIEGNVYVKPLGDGTLWRIARKTDRPGVQRAVWQPIYHSRYVPLDGGRNSPGRTMNPWQLPWEANDTQAWVLDGRRGYRYSGQGSGVIRFDFQHAYQGGPGLYAYNELKPSILPFESIEDVRIAASIEAQSQGMSVELRTTSRLDDPKGVIRPVVGRIDAQGIASLWFGDGEPLNTSTMVGPFVPGQARTVELWYVDQEASLWVDGERVLFRQFDVPVEAIQTRMRPATVPRVAIEVVGSAATLRRVELDRDLYYTGINPHGIPARGALLKTGDSYRGKPVELGSEQYFCLGDNSPLSHDSRYWDEVNPWIEKHMFEDAGGDADKVLGIVPRKLIMGRAFFVYFPTPLRIKPDKPPIIPNIDDMRFIH